MKIDARRTNSYEGNPMVGSVESQWWHGIKFRETGVGRVVMVGDTRPRSSETSGTASVLVVSWGLG